MQALVDRGGTFTDVVGIREDGSVTEALKLPSHSDSYEDAAVEGVQRLLRSEGLSRSDLLGVKAGTTVATNALLERNGARTLLITNHGFADALVIGSQARPSLFSLAIHQPSLLFERTETPSGRIAPSGEELEPLDETHAWSALTRALSDGMCSVAIVMLHSYANAAHERRLATLAERAGFEHVSSSHQCSELMKLIGRGDTATVDAYLSPVLRQYVNLVASRLGDDVDLRFMQSSGGLTSASHFRGKDAILSGPAGGIVGSARTAEAAGAGPNLITFDMGGTSTDVAHYGGELERTFETQIAGVRVRSPMMQIHTVAAGGGSVCTFDGSRFRVGPQSAGANPGPAAYGNTGPATVTDCNVMLGRVQPQFFPKLFGPNQNQPLDAAAAKERFQKLAKTISDNSETAVSAAEAASGFLKIAVENMANAIKKISVQRGYDVTKYTLVSFGGAGGQHACQVADALGMRRVFIHPLAGVLSAYGMGLADISAIRQSTVEIDLSDNALSSMSSTLERLAQEAHAEISGQRVPESDIVLDLRVLLRYKGTDTPLSVPFCENETETMRRYFETLYKERFGFTMPEKSAVVEAAVVEATGRIASAANDIMGDIDASASPQARETVHAFFNGQWQPTPLYKRKDFAPGAEVIGPAMISEENSTTIVEMGWRASFSTKGMLIERVEGEGRIGAGSLTTKRDPIYLEVFNNLFMRCDY